MGRGGGVFLNRISFLFTELEELIRGCVGEARFSGTDIGRICRSLSIHQSHRHTDDVTIKCYYPAWRVVLKQFAKLLLLVKGLFTGQRKEK